MPSLIPSPKRILSFISLSNSWSSLSIAAFQKPFTTPGAGMGIFFSPNLCIPLSEHWLVLEKKNLNQLVPNRLYMHTCLRIQTILNNVQSKVNLSSLNLQSLSPAPLIFSCILPEIYFVFASTYVATGPPFTYINDSASDASLSSSLLICLREHSICLLFLTAAQYSIVCKK